MTADQQWQTLLVALRTEQATGNPERTHTGGLDTDRNRSIRRHTLETETICYDAAHTWERRPRRTG